MICTACREQNHDECRARATDRSWCDCQHQSPGRPVEPATGYASE